LLRTAVTDVYGYLVSDLLEAKSLLKISYPTLNRARPNRATAAALLARIYLYTKDWAKAASEATEVIQSGTYSLVTTLNNVYLPSSTETIWQLVKDNGNTGEGTTFVPASATVKPGYAITTALLNAFESTDKRKLNWLGKNTVAGTEYYYPFKYKVRATTPVTEYYVVFRLAEQYLIRSEAKAMLNDVVDAKADLDVVRNRAGLTGTTASTLATLLTAIEKERQVELFAEWGHRWLDLKRWGRADAVLGPIKGANWQSTDVLYPIPLKEIQLNLSLVQNPGY
jgi:starch-binding outer membrane protein, SusD/RagB family